MSGVPEIHREAWQCGSAGRAAVRFLGGLSWHSCYVRSMGYAHSQRPRDEHKHMEIHP